MTYKLLPGLHSHAYRHALPAHYHLHREGTISASARLAVRDRLFTAIWLSMHDELSVPVDTVVVLERSARL